MPKSNNLTKEQRRIKYKSDIKHKYMRDVRGLSKQERTELMAKTQAYLKWCAESRCLKSGLDNKVKGQTRRGIHSAKYDNKSSYKGWKNYALYTGIAKTSRPCDAAAYWRFYTT